MPLLSFEHVEKTHRVGPYPKRVLADASFSIEPGDLFGVWGPQRSGKSTLLRIAAGLELPDAGRVRFLGADFAALRKERRDRLRLSEIGLARGEGPPSRSMTVLEYVSVPLLATRTRDEAQARARIALRRVDVAECGDAHWDQLSDDERALVSLAHGLVRDPRLLLVDDPTVGLDALQQQEIVDVLRAVAVEQNIGVLMTTSVLSALTGVHQAFTLSDGRMIPVTDVTRPGADIIEFPRGKQAS